ncbi:class I SAM-dependent methyltransferase [Leeuwenhoekiella sp. LLG6367-2.1]|uniref:class I SAM-dependent methyltransferase n=1 Tax=Leeuwenhoekiella sp. LLG6367-2.1 TaxID=3160833 RepID=UPI003866D90F
MIAKKIKTQIPKGLRYKIKSYYNSLRINVNSKNLDRLASYYCTDKFGAHFYTKHYSHHFHKFRSKKLNLLEIGVGGYNNPNKGGESLRMWKKYFRNASIYGLDIYDKSNLEEKRIKIYQGSQVDLVFLNKMVEEIGSLDIVIDDGSHINDHVIETFNFLFAKMNPGGIYVIEDVQTSYWPQFGGRLDRNTFEVTIMTYFKSLVDGLNHAEFINPKLKPSYFDLNILSMHFYHNMIFIYKGANIEKSNFLINNTYPKKD